MIKEILLQVLQYPGILEVEFMFMIRWIKKWYLVGVVSTSNCNVHFTMDILVCRLIML